MHLRHISANIQPKIWNLFISSFYKYETTFDWGEGGPPGHPSRYTLTMKQKLSNDAFKFLLTKSCLRHCLNLPKFYTYRQGWFKIKKF